jgi:hypothetical protein
MNKMLCLIFGHRYRILRKITPYVRELKCKRCKKEFGMNDDVKVVLPLDQELREAHNSMLIR